MSIFCIRLGTVVPQLYKIMSTFAIVSKTDLVLVRRGEQYHGWRYVESVSFLRVPANWVVSSGSYDYDAAGRNTQYLFSSTSFLCLYAD